MNTPRTVAVVLPIIACGLALHVALAQLPGTKRTDLQRNDLSAPGREVAGTIHSVKNVGSGNGAELATYVVEKGKPLITLVQ